MTHYTIQPGDTIQLGDNVAQTPAIPTPIDVQNFLFARGWTEVGPSSQDLWTHNGKQRFVMTWEQAMAIEFFEFITIGGAHGQAQT